MKALPMRTAARSEAAVGFPGVPQSELGRRVPIRDAPVDPSTGRLVDDTGFLRAERNLRRKRVVVR
jgi:hypothetical protein